VDVGAEDDDVVEPLERPQQRLALGRVAVPLVLVGTLPVLVDQL
jgi:hypothetical protein